MKVIKQYQKLNITPVPLDTEPLKIWTLILLVVLVNDVVVAASHCSKGLVPCTPAILNMSSQGTSNWVIVPVTLALFTGPRICAYSETSA